MRFSLGRRIRTMDGGPGAKVQVPGSRLVSRRVAASVRGGKSSVGFFLSRLFNFQVLPRPSGPAVEF